MKLRLALPALAPLVLLAACATTGAQAPSAGLRPTQDVAFDSGPPVSAYGLYLAGQAAMNDDDSAVASQYFARAEQGGLDGAYFREQAFVAALMSGDIARAARLSPNETDTRPVIQRLAALARVVAGIGEGDGKLAVETLASGQVNAPHRPAAALLAPFAAAVAGDKAGALGRPELRGDRLVEVFGQLGQAQLFERAKRYDEAETDYMALVGIEGVGALFAPDYGSFLERRGRWADAAAVYDKALAQSPNDAGLLAARARAASRKDPPPAPTPRQGAARGMVAQAAQMLGDRQYEMAVAYFRMALYLDPDSDEARVMMGDAMAAGKDIVGARAAYAAVGPGSSRYSLAHAKLAWTYQQARDGEMALKLAREGYDAAPTNDEAAITYSDLLRANDHNAEAVTVLDGVIGRAGPTPDWRLLYMRGVALERVGRWPEAERDLQAALASQPNEPELLNYLGYSWIDRGERLAEALDMVKRAVAANPRSGAVVDSLGWAYYRLGDYRNAVEQLETAVLLEPADPEINNHLGDAYWRVGRRIEAEFQWKRALGLEPPEKIKAEAEAKLKSGLGPVGPMPAPVTAAN
ncbi:MAG: tetratricopeptide repeat protein [Caulobacter sp.]|nr:tetratricopeptide repeat protein [Caulobacter sp.]